MCHIMYKLHSLVPSKTTMSHFTLPDGESETLLGETMLLLVAEEVQLLGVTPIPRLLIFMALCQFQKTGMQNFDSVRYVYIK